MDIEKKLIEEYQKIMTERGMSPDWAVRNRTDEDKLVSCSIPFIGKEYFHQSKKILVYASAEVLRDYYPQNPKSDSYWLDKQETAINRHRWFFNQEEFQKDKTSESEKLFFPDVHIQPMNDGALAVAILYIVSKHMEVSDTITPKEFYEKIAFGNYGKYTCETEFQKNLRTTGKGTGKHKNMDYARDKEKLKLSHEYIKADIKNLQPDIIIMPKSIMDTDKEFVQMIKGDANIIPIMQINARNINCHMKGKYSLECFDKLQPNVKDWFDKVHGNSITGGTKLNFRYLFGYLDGMKS